MKLNIIISVSALAASTLGVQLNIHELKDLLARANDPKTMDPARLSVLSVLRTAIESDPAFSRPTVHFEPEWYQKLPENVKNLLPSLYPVAAVEASASTSASGFTSFLTSATSLATSNTAAAVSASTYLPSWTSQITVTKTMQHVPSSAAGHELPMNGSYFIAPTSTNGTSVTASPSQSVPASGGAKDVLRVEKLAALAWVGLGTGFFLFA